MQMPTVCLCGSTVTCMSQLRIEYCLVLMINNKILSAQCFESEPVTDTDIYTPLVAFNIVALKRL